MIEPGVKTVVFDLDGTLALKRQGEGERGYYEWSRVGEDLPNEPIIALCKLFLASEAEVVFLSGRMDSCYDITMMWLLHQLGWENHRPEEEPRLYMRKDGDQRPDDIVKRELFDAHLSDDDILFMVDDRDSVVRMWRKELGLTCLQVEYGDF